MTKDEIYNLIIVTMKKDYDIDISGMPANTPISTIKEMAPKLDSLEYLQFIFGMEDKTGIELPEGSPVPETIGDILDAFVTALGNRLNISVNYKMD